mmetsp:Transcript_4716/g.6355  ORF Transcript_4716/g.6355 Transcript_4716/m.6355 type:complete len:359 (+) Transcript_4716:95-1171(+)
MQRLVSFSKSISSAQSRAFHTIPVIDISALQRGCGSSLANRQAVGAELDWACRNVGFFYVKNHGVDARLSDRVRGLSREWFDLPAAVKNEIALSDCKVKGFRGYQALGANVTRYVGGFQRDWHEAIDLYKECDEIVAGHPEGRPLHATNPWPTQVPEYRETLQTYVGEMVGLGASILRGIALGLNLDEEFFAGARAGDPFWVMRVIHYPPLPLCSQAEGQLETNTGQELERSVQLSCGEHTDYGLLTMVNQDPDVAALQVKNTQGEWISASPIPNTFVCNIGDMLKVWTNGRYQPTLHRVVNQSRSNRRVSVPFFYEPNFDTFVAPLSEFCSETNPPMYDGIKYGDHLQQKVYSNFEL